MPPHHLRSSAHLPPLLPGTNDLSPTLLRGGRRLLSGCEPIPPAVICVLIPLFLAGIGVSIFIIVAVHNALLLVSLLLLSLLVLAFLAWNAYGSARERAAQLYLESFPFSDLGRAVDGQLVKITGFVSCANTSLISSYEKIPRCIYTSTLLRQCRCFQLKPILRLTCFPWNLKYSERFIVDFYITDIKSGMRIMVKAGFNSDVIPLIDEDTIVNTTNSGKILSSTLTKWLGERNLSAEACALRLDEGYVKEGSVLTVMGKLCRTSEVLMIVPLAEPISTGCIMCKLLLPRDINGLILSFSCNHNSTSNHFPFQNPRD